eukprot:266091_1
MCEETEILSIDNVMNSSCLNGFTPHKRYLFSMSMNRFAKKIVGSDMNECIHNCAPFTGSLDFAKWLINFIKTTILKAPNRKTERESWFSGAGEAIDYSKTRVAFEKFIFGFPKQFEFKGYCKLCCWNLYVLSERFLLFHKFQMFIDEFIWNQKPVISDSQKALLEFLLCVIQNIIVCPAYIKLMFKHENKVICKSFLRGLMVLIKYISYNVHINHQQNGKYLMSKELLYQHERAKCVAFKAFSTVRLYIYYIIKYLDYDLKCLVLGRLTCIALSLQQIYKHENIDHAAFNLFTFRVFEFFAKEDGMKELFTKKTFKFYVIGLNNSRNDLETVTDNKTSNQ